MKLIEYEKIEEAMCINFRDMDESILYDTIMYFNYNKLGTKRLAYYLDNMVEYYAFRRRRIMEARLEFLR